MDVLRSVHLQGGNIMNGLAMMIIVIVVPGVIVAFPCFKRPAEKTAHAV